MSLTYEPSSEPSTLHPNLGPLLAQAERGRVDEAKRDGEREEGERVKVTPPPQ